MGGEELGGGGDWWGLVGIGGGLRGRRGDGK